MVALVYAARPNECYLQDDCVRAGANVAVGVAPVPILTPSANHSYDVIVAAGPALAGRRVERERERRPLVVNSATLLVVAVGLAVCGETEGGLRPGRERRDTRDPGTR